MMYSRLLVVILLGGCHDPDPVPPLFPASGQDRVLESGAWDTLWAIGGEADTLLAYPAKPTPLSNGGLYFVDAVTTKLHYVDAQGRLECSFGTLGSGPGELMEARIVASDHLDNVVLVDNGNRRILTLALGCRLVREDVLPADIRFVMDAVVLDEFIVLHQMVLGDSLASPWVVVDREGQLVGPVGLPSEGFKDLEPMQYAGQLGRLGGNRWAHAFTVGNGWFTFDLATPIDGYPFLEHVPFPRVITTIAEGGSARMRYEDGERPVDAAVATSLRGDTLVVFFGGSSAHRLRVLDRYDIDTGDYINSLLLPGPATSVAVNDAGTVFIIDNWGLSPVVAALRFRVEGSSAAGNPPQTPVTLP